MEKKTKVTKIKIVQLIAAFIGFVLYVVCFSTPAWILYSLDTDSVTAGLFQMCVGESGCRSVAGKDDMFTAAKALGCLGLVCYLCFCITVTCSMIRSKYFKTAKLAAFISSLSAGTFIAIALLLMLQSKVAMTSKLGYSGICGVISVFIALILCPFYSLNLKQFKQISKLKVNREDKKPLPFNIAPTDTKLSCKEAWTPTPSLFEFNGQEEKPEEDCNQVKRKDLEPMKTALLYKENTISDLELIVEDISDLNTDQHEDNENEVKISPPASFPVQLKPPIYFQNKEFAEDDLNRDPVDFYLSDEGITQSLEVNNQTQVQRISKETIEHCKGVSQTLNTDIQLPIVSKSSEIQIEKNNENDDKFEGKKEAEEEYLDGSDEDYKEGSDNNLEEESDKIPKEEETDEELEEDSEKKHEQDSYEEQEDESDEEEEEESVEEEEEESDEEEEEESDEEEEDKVEMEEEKEREGKKIEENGEEHKEESEEENEEALENYEDEKVKQEDMEQNKEEVKSPRNLLPVQTKSSIYGSNEENFDDDMDFDIDDFCKELDSYSVDMEETNFDHPEKGEAFKTTDGELKQYMDAEMTAKELAADSITKSMRFAEADESFA